MANTFHIILLISASLYVFVECSSIIIALTADGPVVLGANVTIKVELFSGYVQHPTGLFTYKFEDGPNSPKHFHEIHKVNETTVYWNVSYPREIYQPGKYTTKVSVYEEHLNSFTSSTIDYEITNMFNGKITLNQNGEQKLEDVVSSGHEVTHEITLSPTEQEFIKKNATSVLTYWFVNCVPYGYSTNLSFFFNYTSKNVYQVEAVVIASFDKHLIGTTETPLTTQASLTNVSSSVSPTTEPTTVPVVSTATPKITIYGTINDSVLPFVCGNSSFMTDQNKTYGYFQKSVTAKEPIANVTVNGNNWLQPQDVLNLQILCNGSSKFYHCLKIKAGIYNVTGKESCISELTSDHCIIKMTHYFKEPSTYTILAVIRNDVSKFVIPVVIHMYVVTKQPQLSVIVVPVTFSILAVIIIVFGVAYYVQSRNRCTIEVADFDFGQVNNMEYKTFNERLLEGIRNVFNHSAEEDPQPAVPPRRNYDKMTDS